MNGVRGEVEAELGGRTRRLCLTLGALAEIETALGVGGAGALAERMAGLSAREVSAVLAALLKGGGEGDADLSGVTPLEAARAIAAAFRAAAP